MPVDEFGREIQGATYPRSPSPKDHHYAPTRRPYSYSDADEYPSRPRSRRSPARRTQSPPPPRRHYPVERYVSDPMLCEYLWKQSVAREAEDAADERPLTKLRDASDFENNYNNTSDRDYNQQQGDDLSPAPRAPETYDQYRSTYCLNYVRAFFNQHIDDSWFRKTYSPLEQKRAAMEELKRAAHEAQALTDQVLASPDTFVRQARLGDGTKLATHKRKHDEPINALPQSHVHSTLERTVAIHDIPPYVTDMQLSQTLLYYCSIPTQTISVSSSSVTTDPSSKTPLYRQAFAVFDSIEARKDMLTNLAKANSALPDTPSDGHVPRKEDHNDLPNILDLPVECADAYGRVDMDGDGKGNAPLDETLKVRERKCTVLVMTAPLHPPVVVLSVAVSSTERIPRDKDAAILMARAWDVSRSIPNECRLDGVLDRLLEAGSLPDADLLDVSIAYLRRVHLLSFYNGCTAANQMGDVLAGQHAAGSIHLRLKGADDLLRKAREDDHDDTLDIYGDLEKPAPSTMTDLLVQRLDDSIARALAESTDRVAKGGMYVLDEIRDGQAAEIEEWEEQARRDWIDNHTIADSEGRARCSFHSCRKLFKGESFLQNHLLKKHGEHLEAEVAKCHDPYMMKTWDAEINRPVPPVLVDCGEAIGMVTSPVSGADPMAVDPEPELWRQEQERRHQKMTEEEAERRREEAARHAELMDEPRVRAVANFVDVDDMKEEKVELSFENVEVVVPPPKKKRKKLL